MSPPASLPEGARRIFRILTETLVPEAAALDAEGWSRALALVEGALARRDPGLRRRLLLFLRFLQWLPLFRHGRPFTGLDPVRRLALLEALQDSRWTAIRRGVWGLRTLAFLGYYGRPEVYAEIGYRAHIDGWEARDEPAPWTADEAVTTEDLRIDRGGDPGSSVGRERRGGGAG